MGSLESPPGERDALQEKIIGFGAVTCNNVVNSH
jgi:hypothetical protein